MNQYLKERGVISIIAFLALGILLILSSYLLSSSLGESKISRSQRNSTKAYYLAEAGINEAIWKLKNDETETDGDDPWAVCFASSTGPCGDCGTWSATLTRSNSGLGLEGTTTVSVNNSECARAEIIATSTLPLAGGKNSQRVVKTAVFKSLASPTGDSVVFSGGSSENIDISGSMIKIYGNIFSNHHLNVKFFSTLEVHDATSSAGKILAGGNYNKSLFSMVSSAAICAKNTCNTTSTCACEENEEFEECNPGGCPPNSVSSPTVDFDSSATTSFKSRAQEAQDAGLCENLCNGSNCLCEGNPCPGRNKCVLTEEEFEDLLWAAGEDGTLSLNSSLQPGIVYVEGGIELRGGRKVTVYGALVADNTVDIGERYSWTRKGQKDEGLSQITINRPAATTTSGLLTKAKINFGPYSSFTTTDITGVVYGNDEVRFISLPKEFNIVGGIIGRKLSFTSAWQWFNFFLDNEVVLYGLGYKIDEEAIKPTYSPVITIDHWEETY